MKYLIFFLISAGLFFSCEKAKPQAGHDDHKGHKHDSHAGHNSHKGHGHEPNAEVILSEQALTNMGVVIKEIDSSDYIVFTPAPAYISERPLNEQPVYAPYE